MGHGRILSGAALQESFIVFLRILAVFEVIPPSSLTLLVQTLYTEACLLSILLVAGKAEKSAKNHMATSSKEGKLKDPPSGLAPKSPTHVINSTDMFCLAGI